MAYVAVFVMNWMSCKASMQRSLVASQGSTSIRLYVALVLDSQYRMLRLVVKQDLKLSRCGERVSASIADLACQLICIAL